jgi:hypothetical protein
MIFYDIRRVAAFTQKNQLLAHHFGKKKLFACTKKYYYWHGKNPTFSVWLIIIITCFICDLVEGTCYRRNVNKDGTGMLSYDNDLPLPVLVLMKTSFPSAKALKLSALIFLLLIVVWQNCKLLKNNYFSDKENNKIKKKLKKIIIIC